MAIQLVDLGYLANDGSGDDLRTAFEKINANFQEVSGDNLTGLNLGVNGSSIFVNRVEDNLRFRKLLAGTNISLQETDNNIIVNSTTPTTNFVITTDAGSIVVNNNVSVSIRGENGIEVTGNENQKRITISLNDITNDLNLRGNGLVNVSSINGLSFEQTVGRYSGYDFGENFNSYPVSILDFVINTVGVEMGTFGVPSPYGALDFGELT